jgi:hypothetical protein
VLGSSKTTSLTRKKKQKGEKKEKQSKAKKYIPTDLPPTPLSCLSQMLRNVFKTSR